MRRYIRYVDKNHPHHLTRADVRRFLLRHFAHVELSRVVTLIDDQFVLQTACYVCRKE